MDIRALVSLALDFLRVAGPLLLTALFTGRKWMLGLFESEGVPSIRKVAFLAVVIGVLRSADLHAGPIVDSLLVFASSLVVAGTAKIIASRFSPKPTVDLTQEAAKSTDNQP